MSDVVRPAADPESEPFWATAREHRLCVQRCDECATLRFPPRPICRRCGSPAATWTPVSGHGRVLSWTVIHHVNHPAFAPRAPYPVLLVRLDEQDDIVMYGNLHPVGAEITAGMRVQVFFEDIDDELTLVQWSPAPGDEARDRRPLGS